MDKKVGSYILFYFQAVHIGYDSVSKYNSCILPAPEQHFWPSSLAFGKTKIKFIKKSESLLVVETHKQNTRIGYGK